jgi:prenyltransferase beta subunit
MTKEMYRKQIELARIVKTCALLLLSGLASSSIEPNIIKACSCSQKADGGFTGTSDTLWSIVLLKNYPAFSLQVEQALAWLESNTDDYGGFGRTQRDMRRIPVTGLALYLLPEILPHKHLKWLENAWTEEMNSLTYKAAYTLMAFSKTNYQPSNNLIERTVQWLVNQQEQNGGFAPWIEHPVGPNIYCTSIASLGLLSFGKEQHKTSILKAYDYMKQTQLPSGIWPYHEIEDGASWGLYAMTQIEQTYGELLDG